MAAKYLDKAQVKTVYAGKAGKCCCGCSGKHYEASNTRMVNKVLAAINAADALTDNEEDVVSVEVEGRWFIAYLN